MAEPLGSTAGRLPERTMLPASADATFDRIANLTRRVLGVPTALVSLVDQDRQAFPGIAGLAEPWATRRETPLSHSFCQYVVANAEPLVIEDAEQHPVLVSNRAVEDLGVVAYAGMPITDRSGAVVGSLCAIDRVPRQWTAEQLQDLADLAATCSAELELRQVAELLAEQAEHNRSVAQSLQAMLLSALPVLEGLSIAARYSTATGTEQVGGDWYDAVGRIDGTATVSIGDVSGHDIGAAAQMGHLRAMLRAFLWIEDSTPSLAVCQLDRSVRGQGYLATLIVARLGRPRADGTRTMTWTNAGHPPPIVLQPDGTTDVLATRSDVMLGVWPDSDRHDHHCPLAPGATLFVYTDGLIENSGEDLSVGIERLRAAVTRHRRADLDGLVGAVLTDLRAGACEDDIAVLAVRNDARTDG